MPTAPTNPLCRFCSAHLDHIFVETDESAFIPSIRWIDLFGVDIVSGAPLVERLRP